MSTAVVLEKATALAEALEATDELRTVREKEAVLKQDPLAKGIIDNYFAIQNDLQQRQMQGEKISDELIAQLTEAEKQMEGNTVVNTYYQAQENLSQLLSQVNSILSRALSAEEPDCSPSQCAGCSGC